MTVFLIGSLSLLSACTYYQVAPGTYASEPVSKFDRAWAAAAGAFADEDVVVQRQDRDAGEIQGTRSGINLTALLRTLADGSVRVEFKTSGATKNDPELIQRVSDAYDRRMGR